MNDLGDQGAVSKLIDKRSDDELAALMGNLGGHDLPSLLDAFAAAQEHDRPVCFIAYTIKGFGLPLAGHKDNHAGLLTAPQVEGLRRTMNIRNGHEWDRLEGVEQDHEGLERFLKDVPFVQHGPRRYRSDAVRVPDGLAVSAQPEMSTQQGFGLIMHEI